MKPIKFKEMNVTYAEDQPEYQPLPVYKKEGVEGEITICWHLNLFERLWLLLTGKMWMSIYTFNKPLQPLLPSATKRKLFRR